MEQKLDKTYWDARYSNNEIQWDLGYASPPLKEYIDQLQSKDLRILIPGAGNAYEAEYLLEKGFNNITVVDISPIAIEAVKKRLEKYDPSHFTLVCEDFFDHNGLYDLVLEQTFFCAIDPQLRSYYADKVYNNLDIKGKLAGVLFNRDFEGGPPFGGSPIEYEQTFKSLFEIIKMEEAYNSVQPRKGNEVFIIMQKK